MSWKETVRKHSEMTRKLPEIVRNDWETSRNSQKLLGNQETVRKKPEVIRND